MPLACMKTLLQEAGAENRGVGAFSVGNMEMILGAVQAAEEMNTPIILQIAEVRLPYAPLNLIGPMMVTAAEQAKVDVAVHFDHGQTAGTVEQALHLGFTSVMYDGSLLPYKENVKNTRAVVKLAKTYGAAVEAELGVVGGSEDGKKNTGSLCTDPEEAERFAAETEADALAVAIGNAHGNYPVAPRLRFDVLEAIQKRVAPLPLVLHGGTGITPGDFRQAVDLGVRKINIATANFQSLTKECEAYLSQPGGHNYFDLNTAMTYGVYENVKRHIAIFNNGKDLRK